MLPWLTGGIFLGWALGSNDAANVFGTAVSTQTLRFRTAAIILCIFLLAGAMLGGQAGMHTLSGLRANTLSSAFVITFSAALTVTIMSIVKIPVSASQAVIGSIIGSGFACCGETNLKPLLKVFICWAGTPLGAMLLSVILYKTLGYFWQKVFKNIIIAGRTIQIGLILTGVYGSYALGANNSANVTGVFLGLDTGFFIITPFVACLIGGLSIALGVITFGKRVMSTIGRDLVPLEPFTALIAVLSQAVTVHFYALLGVPVSTSQAVIGAVLGIGILKGMRSINTGVLLHIVIGWVSTPVLSGIFAFFITKMMRIFWHL
ncbi:MAG: hypothetical protein A2096_04380 [Spirochaetes bacterium GWF1_41_5]|nr:MAG: hypothetical protein A2096_04380 [Spirochaetes bacterium GWF1_41_5]